MSQDLRQGDLVYYYAPAHDFVVRGRIIELPDGHREPKVEIVESPDDRLLAPGDVKFFPLPCLFRTEEQAHAFARGYDQPLARIRTLVLANLRSLPPELVPLCYTDSYTQEPRKMLDFMYGRGDWIKYRVTLFPGKAEVKLTLAKKEPQKRRVAKTRLLDNRQKIREALGAPAKFTTQMWHTRAIREVMDWTGRSDDVARKITLYITTLQPMLHDL